MNVEQLDKVNELKSDIGCLEFFLDFYERSPIKNKLAFKRQKYKFFIKRLGWGPIESEDYDMDKETEKRVVKALYERLAELKREFGDI